MGAEQPFTPSPSTRSASPSVRLGESEATIFILDPAAILAIAALIGATSTLVWAVRSKP
jgi:hypothetical protein